MKRAAAFVGWVIFSGLIGVIGYRLTEACRIEIGGLFRFPFQPDVCRGPTADQPNRRAVEIRSALNDLERQVAVRQAICSAQNACPAPAPAAPAQTLPSPRRETGGPAGRPGEACIPRSSAGAVAPQIAFIVDVTTSMVSDGGSGGIGVVQRHVPEALAALRIPSVHLHWYNQCSSVETRVVSPSEAASLVRSFDPHALARGVSQGEPATLAISRALQGFSRGADGRVTGRIVLFTDDEDQCPSNAPLHDACALGAAIAREHPNVRVNLVALGPRAMTLACVATATGGRTWQPGQSNPQELVAALAEATQLPVCPD